MNSWLVTGGAGYIGSHVVRALIEGGFNAVAFDDLSTGKEAFVPPQATLVVGDILDQEALYAALASNHVVGVIHCAGYKFAGESVKYPVHTYRQNVTGTGELLAAMARAEVTRLVFSSSAGVYGTPNTEVVTETSPCRPESPYGESKLVAEWLIAAQVAATAASKAPLSATSLRYFNVVGSGSVNITDLSPHNLFPKVFAALENGQAPRINGNDYATPDGTCIRDYVHVADLARAHVVAAERLGRGETLASVYNLGSGDGTSVAEIVQAMLQVTGVQLEPEVGPRRPGDPARIVARGDLAATDLAWAPSYSVLEMVQTAWDAHLAWQARADSTSTT